MPRNLVETIFRFAAEPVLFISQSRQSHKFVYQIAILALLVRGTFYCVEQPIWEPFDEFAHFAYVQHLAKTGYGPTRDSTISDELSKSLRLAPLPPPLAKALPGTETHSTFWQLTIEERYSREHQLLRLRPADRYDPTVGEKRQYEAQQPPLYYWIVTPIYIALRNSSLPTQVVTLRLLSFLIAAMGIVLSYQLALRVSASRNAAVSGLVLLAAWPGLLIEVCRVGNDCLALTLGSAFIVCLFRITRANSTLTHWIVAAVVLGLGLLTKSYLLALAPLLPLLAVLEVTRHRLTLSQMGRHLFLSCAVTTAIAGWWYVANWRFTGTLSGEQLDIAAAHLGAGAKLAAIRSIHWIRVLNFAAKTYTWTGGWSFLQVRRWMYAVFEFIAAMAGVGVVMLLIRIVRKTRRRGLADSDVRFLISVLTCSLFGFALAYHAIVVYLTEGTSLALGWYMYGVVGAMSVTLVGGVTGIAGTRWSTAWVAGLAILACIFDLYTVHFLLIPYHAGLATLRSNGLLTTFHPSQLHTLGIGEVLARLSVNKPQGIGSLAMAVLWAGYVGATFALVVCSFATVRNAYTRNRTSAFHNQKN